jgi:hypothetical protein
MCVDPDFDCYSKQMLAGVWTVRESISYWSNLHLALQIFIAVARIVTTVMIALEGDENGHWTKPIGLVATALVTGLTSPLVSFMSQITRQIDLCCRKNDCYCGRF